MKRFRFHWLTGETCEGEGTSPEDAFTHLGYGAGALNSLDFFEEITDPKQSLRVFHKVWCPLVPEGQISRQAQELVDFNLSSEHEDFRLGDLNCGDLEEIEVVGLPATIRSVGLRLKIRGREDSVFISS
jgi:hypothetical protein